jgi:hypothetical protein
MRAVRTRPSYWRVAGLDNKFTRVTTPLEVIGDYVTGQNGSSAKIVDKEVYFIHVNLIR